MKPMILGKIICFITLVISTRDTGKYVVDYINLKKKGILVKGEIIGRELKKGHSRFFVPKVEYILEGVVVQSLARMPMLNVYWLPKGKEVTLFISPIEPNFCIIKSTLHLITSISLLIMIYFLCVVIILG